MFKKIKQKISSKPAAAAAAPPVGKFRRLE
jgi:hypothetical protein